MYDRIRRLSLQWKKESKSDAITAWMTRLAREAPRPARGTGAFIPSRRMGPQSRMSVNFREFQLFASLDDLVHHSSCIVGQYLHKSLNAVVADAKEPQQRLGS